jgi:NTE family protein
VRTAYVFSGGGSLGAVQVGMLQALADREFRPDLLVGASAGALNAAFVARRGCSGRTVDELADIWRRLRRNEVFPLSPARQVLALAGARPSLCSPEGMRRLVDVHLGGAQIESCQIELLVVATDVRSGVEVVLSGGEITPAVLASTAVPAVFPTVTIDGRPLFDGGIANNTPISAAIAAGADRVVVLPAGVACALTHPPRSALATAVHALTLLVEQRLALDVAATRDEVELIVLPPLCPLPVSSADFRFARWLIDRSRSSTGRWLDAGYHRLPYPERFLGLHQHEVAVRTPTPARAIRG